MHIADCIELHLAGNHEGSEKGWDSRGRKNVLEKNGWKKRVSTPFTTTYEHGDHPGQSFEVNNKTSARWAHRVGSSKVAGSDKGTEKNLTKYLGTLDKK
jgi:hypothetical protein